MSPALLLSLFLARPALALPDGLRDPGATAALPVVSVQGLSRKGQQEAEAQRQQQPGFAGASRYAVAREVSVDFAARAAWRSLPDGRRVGQLRVLAPTAENLSLAFSRAELPPGAELWLHAANGRQALDRPLTAADTRHGDLWTPVQRGDELVASVVLPVGAPMPQLLLSRVHVGFSPIGERRPLQGACNIDVACPQADDWQEEVHSVAVYGMSGEFWCTGFLLNNTAGDQTPYFATANHCGVRSSNASSLVVYWNYESPACGDLSGGVDNEWQTGSTFRMRTSQSDWCLVELDDAPDPSWEVSWAGWDRSDTAPDAAVTIHHPGTDEKAISFEDDPTRITWPYESGSSSDGSHIRIIDWDLGTTEGGSSGSPLFNPEHRAVGVLTGGDAACGNNSSDWYGRMYTAWDQGPAAESLVDWLDSSNSGATTTDTLAPWAGGVTVSPTEGLRASGPEGGPFIPGYVDLSFRNRDDASRTVRLEASEPWVGLSTNSLSLGAGDSGTARYAFNAAANALGIGLHTATVTLSDDSPGSSPRNLPVRLIVGEQEARYSWNMDEDPGWETEGDWEWGPPEGRGGSTGSRDPSSGATGANVYGYNLAGDYADNLREQDLTTAPIDMRNMAGTTIRFKRWLGVEESAYDHATVSVSTDGSSWQVVWENLGEVDDGAWVPVEIDLADHADGQPQVWVRWTMGSTDDSVRYCGWNLDDVEIWGVRMGPWDEEVEPGDSADPDSGAPDSGQTDGSDDDGAGPQPDTGGSKSAGQPDDQKVSACGCAAGGGAATGALGFLIGLVAALRRRRD